MSDQARNSHDFFISYSASDKDWAAWIAWMLEEHGYKTVIQEWDFPPGSNYTQEMHNAAIKCKRTIAVLSEDYIKATFTQSEWQAAFAADAAGKQRKLVPVRVRECRLEGLLAQILYIDLIGLGEEEAIHRLLEGIKPGRAKPKGRPEFPQKKLLASRPRFPGVPIPSIPRRSCARFILYASFLALIAFFVLLYAQTRPPDIEGFAHLHKNRHGHHEYQHEQTGIVMVLLPSNNTFTMGGQENGEEDEKPLHAVRLSRFLIAKYEVSQRQWTSVMGENPSEFKGDDLPIENVSWNACRTFCDRTGLKLPTEAQWEYACRAGSSTPFAFGETITPDTVNYNSQFPYGDTAKEEPRNRPVPVDSFQPNGFGLHQMHGNVSEWCEDVYDPEFYTKLSFWDQDGRRPQNQHQSGYHSVAATGRWAYCRPARAPRGARSPLIFDS